MPPDDLFLLYTGCLIRSRLPHVEKSARAVFEAVGVRVSDLEGASCCPDPAAMRSVDPEAWVAMAARNLALAGDHRLMTLCSGCYSTFREARHQLASDHSLQERTRVLLAGLGHEYSLGPPAEHFARFLFETVGPEGLADRVTRSWKGLPMAVHHGCHFLRPSLVIGFDDPENPTKLEELVRSLGAEPVDYPRKMLCCGYTIQGKDPGLSLRMAYEKLTLMKDSGARAVIVVCPSCYLQFDLMQRSVEQEFGVTLKLPVLYLTEFVGLALGLPASSLGVGFHRVDVTELIHEVFPDDSPPDRNSQG